MVGNVEGVRLRNDEEALHQLRIGVRRFRATLVIAREAGLAPAPESMREELKWLWSLLGEAREWDVFVTRSWPAISSASGGTTTVATLARAAMKLRASSHSKLRRALGSKRFQQLMRDLAAFDAREGGASLHHEAAGGSEGLARRILSKRAAKVRRRGKRIDRLASSEKHKLRIAVKSLRYAAEFLSGLYDAKTSAAYLKHLAMVQAVLGEINDLVVAGGLLQRIANGAPGVDATFATSAWRRYAVSEQKRLRRRLVRKWRDWKESVPFWD